MFISMGSRLSLSDMSSRIDRVLWVSGPGLTTKLVGFLTIVSRGGLGIKVVVINVRRSKTLMEVAFP